MAVIIAMQGEPFTGKTTLANILARRLNYSIIRFDDILDFVPNPKFSKKPGILVSQAFDLLVQIVQTQTTLGISVIVDSPLCRRAHLDKLIGLVGENKNNDEKVSARRLIIIQCKPKTKYVWETRFNDERGSSYDDKWYKPQKWPIDKEFTRDYNDKDNPEQQLVSKLVVNTTDYVPPDPLVQVVLHLINSKEVQVVHFQKWLQKYDVSPPRCYKRKLDSLDLNPANERPSKRPKHQFCNDGHYVKEFQQQGILYNSTCEVCDKNLVINSDAAYTCTDCPMAIHKSCAELPESTTEFTPQDFPKFLKRDLHKATFCFPVEHSCSVCTNGYSLECGSCLFKSHVKSGLLPTIVHHGSHDEHRLFFWVRPVSMAAKFQCAACKELTNFVGYSCIDGCVNYHPECVFLPRVLKHEHGGHEHELELIFKRKKSLEDYECGLCDKKMNPDAWYYSCNHEDCVMDLHLDCAFREYS